MGGMGGMGGGETQSFIGSLSGSSFCGDCTVLAGQIVLKYMDGTIANISNGVYVHHILTSGLKANPAFVRSCAGGGLDGGSGFVGNGDDNSNEPVLYASKDGTLETGYWVSPTDRFMGTYVLVNYNKEPKKIYVFYDLEWVPGLVGDDVKTATLTATCGGSMAVKLSNAGPTNTTSGKFYFKEDGKLLTARGHLHDGGVKVSLILNDKFMCSSDAVYGERPSDSGGMGGGHSHGGSAPAGKSSAPAVKTISSMNMCNKQAYPVKKGDTLKLVAEYDLTKHPLRTTSSGKAADVMGMMGLSFSATKK